MRNAILMLGLMPPAITTCVSGNQASVQTRTVMAIYAPPVRLGGTGSVIFLPAPPQQPPPPPPADVTTDYLPGPWAIPFDADATRPPSTANAVFEQIAIMTKRFPSVGVSLCSIGPSRARTADDRGRRRLETVRAALITHGVRKIALRADRGCSRGDDRSGPAVLIAPVY